MVETADYRDPVAYDDDIMTVEEFHRACETGLFTDYDGFGQPARDNKTSWDCIKPSNRFETIPSDATHVVWFNR